MQPLNVRLARANGPNATLCHRAKDRLMKYERKIHALQEFIALHVDVDILPESLARLYSEIVEEYNRKEDKKRWSYEDSNRA